MKQLIVKGRFINVHVKKDSAENEMFILQGQLFAVTVWLCETQTASAFCVEVAPLQKKIPTTS